MPRSRRSPRFRATTRRRVGAALCAAVIAVTLAACSSTVDGHPVRAASSRAPTTTASSVPAATPSSTTAASFVCPGTSPEPVVTCLEQSLSDFWSGQLNHAIDQPTVLAPSSSQVPAGCRGGLDLGTAFTCSTDGKLYVTSKFLGLITGKFGDADLGYALAALQAHEMGHAVQYAVHQPAIEIKNPTPAQSQEVEQQADCLGAVWAYRVAQSGGLDVSHYESVNYDLIVLISSNAEIATHGTPPERRAAVDRGLAGGRPQDCQLATFH